jgi:peptide chain release factor subunit 1
MLTAAALQELVAFKANGNSTPVLSLYLNVDPHRSTETYRLALRNMLDSVNDEISRKDREAIERYVDREYDWHGRGLACFSCAAEDFWHVYPLMVPVQDTVFVGPRPYVKPLGDLLDTYARYGVALVDREGAHLFLFNMGALEEVTGVAGEDVKRHKQGGWAAARYQRHEDEAAYRNLKEAAEMTAQIVREGRCRRLILGGTYDNVVHFSDMLPKDVGKLVVGSINADMTASPTEIQEKSLALIREASAARKQELVEQLITTAAKGGPAALGIVDTLSAVYAARAYHVVLDDSYAQHAFRCDTCGFVGTEEADACPQCGSSLRILPDAADSLVRWAVSQGIELTVVSDSPQLAEMGHIGAFLRW